jgi:hypothetical protein
LILSWPPLSSLFPFSFLVSLLLSLLLSPNFYSYSPCSPPCASPCFFISLLLAVTCALFLFLCLNRFLCSSLRTVYIIIYCDPTRSA